MLEFKNKYTNKLYWRLWNFLPTTKDSFTKPEIYPNTMTAVILFFIAKLQHTGRHVYSMRLKRTLCIIKSKKVHNFSA